MAALPVEETGGTDDRSGHLVRDVQGATFLAALEADRPRRGAVHVAGSDGLAVPVPVLEAESGFADAGHVVGAAVEHLARGERAGVPVIGGQQRAAAVVLAELVDLPPVG